MRRARFTALSNTVRSGAIVAVDLGYSSSRKTCGIARSVDNFSACHSFGNSLAVVVNSLTSNPTQILVLEAVLSTSHCRGGNPRDRGDFEKGRSWYYGPGAVTFLAATRFLSELDRLLPRHLQVRLAEAFLSNKVDRSGHDEDAKLIAEKFWSSPIERSIHGLEPILPLVSGVPPVRSFRYAS